MSSNPLTNQELDFESIQDGLINVIDDFLLENKEVIKTLTDRQISRLDDISSHAGTTIENILDGQYDK